MKSLVNATIGHGLTDVKQGRGARGRHRAAGKPTIEALARLMAAIPWRLVLTEVVQLIVVLQRPHG